MIIAIGMRINTGYLKPLLSGNPEEKTGEAKDNPEEGKKEGGKKDYGF